MKNYGCAFVGVAFYDRVIYNVVLNDSEFKYTGLSIISLLKKHKNKFIANLIESQSYNSIKYIFDDKMIFDEFFDITNENREKYKNILNFMKEDNIYGHFYIYDLENDKLIVKTPNMDNPVALDYNDEISTREFMINYELQDY